MNEVTIEKAIEADMFGYGTTYDGDNRKVLYNTYCGYCGKYLESERICYYCTKCLNKK